MYFKLSQKTAAEWNSKTMSVRRVSLAPGRFREYAPHGAHTAQHGDRTAAAWILPRLRVQHRNQTTGHNTAGGRGVQGDALGGEWAEQAQAPLQLILGETTFI